MYGRGQMLEEIQVQNELVPRYIDTFVLSAIATPV